MKPIINIKFGDAPVAHAVIEAAKSTYMDARGWTNVMRDDAMVEPTLAALGWIGDTPAFMRAMQALSGFENALLLTLSINQFNAQLAAYRKAVARLSRYRVAIGRAEAFEDQPTDQFDDETGEPIMASVLVQSAIDPLPETIDEARFDADTGEALDPETVPNPAIVKDDAERAAAQAVIDQTPQAVKDWT